MHHHIHNKTLRTRHQTPLTPCVHHGHAFHAIARRSSTRVHALGDWVKKFFDVSDGNWGPKSTRIWRTQNYEYTSGNDEAEGGPRTQGSGGLQHAVARPPPTGPCFCISGTALRTQQSQPNNLDGGCAEIRRQEGGRAGGCSQGGLNAST